MHHVYQKEGRGLPGDQTDQQISHQLLNITKYTNNATNRKFHKLVSFIHEKQV